MSLRSSLFSLAVAGGALASSNYTWPSEIDFLEGLFYEQVGRDAFTPAAVVAPCGIVNLGEGRHAAAEWLRTAFHDAATADVAAGTGGLDGSIGFELDRPENPGTPKFTETLKNMSPFLTARSSMADLIALGAIVSVGACSSGRVLVPFRTGRIDATAAGPSGVPQPQDALGSISDRFKGMGFTDREMVGLTACGHTLGGVHGVDFPQIVDVPANASATDENTQGFDETLDTFDNNVAVDYVNGTKQNPLAFGHNETTNSDARIFSSDNSTEIGKLAASAQYFYDACTDLLGRMVDTVPKAVKLSAPLEPIQVKPLKLFASVTANNTLSVGGWIRLPSASFDPDPNRTVTVRFQNRTGADCTADQSCVSAPAVGDPSSWSAAGYGGGGGSQFPLFLKYVFSAEVPIATGMKGFVVEIADKQSDGTTTTTVHDNGGGGYPFDDALLVQKESSCTGVRDDGSLNVTVAVRNDAGLHTVSGIAQLPDSLTALVPALKTVDLKFSKAGPAASKAYTLYNAVTKNDKGIYTTTYDVKATNGKRTVQSLFHNGDDLASC